MREGFFDRLREVLSERWRFWAIAVFGLTASAVFIFVPGTMRFGAALAADGPGGPPPLARGKPNIILFLADDQGMVDVGAYGGAYSTPNIDALAASGVRFEFGYATPQCGPTRAQILSGRYPFRTGVVDNQTGGKITPQNSTIIAKVLKQAGYATAFAGKWEQLKMLQSAADGQAWGFDEFLAWRGGGDTRYWGPVYDKNGVVTTYPDTVYGPDLLHDFVIDFITRNKDKPFFVYYPQVLIHEPTLPFDRGPGLLAFKTPGNAGTSDLFADDLAYLEKYWRKEMAKLSRHLSSTSDTETGDVKFMAKTPDSTETSDLYADNVAYSDKLLGKLMADLDRLGLREKTLVLFVGDNGSASGKQTINGKRVDGRKENMGEGGSRVPFIASWKGMVPAGVVSNDLVDVSDVLPTFAELAGAPLPAGQIIDGHSFAPQILGRPAQPREWVYVQHGSDCYLRDSRYKLYCSGAFADMADAPFSELALPVGSRTPEQTAAFERLQRSLNGLLK